MSITMLKFLMLGALAFTFVASPVFAASTADNGQEEVAPKRMKKKNLKRRSQLSMFKPTVAIAKFENKSAATEPVVEMIRARVKQCVVAAHKFEVVECEQLKAAMGERTLAATGQTSDEDTDASTNGRMAISAYAIYGTVLYFGQDKITTASEGADSRIEVSKVEILFKFVACATGKTLMQKSVIGYGVDRARATENVENALSQGLCDALDEACRMASDVLRVYPIKVIQVGKRDLTINITEEEVHIGEIFDVFTADEPKVDSDTGAFLGYNEEHIGRVMIRQVGPNVSKAVPVEDGDLSLDDIDTDEHTYIVRRVSKTTLRREKESREGRVQH